MQDHNSPLTLQLHQRLLEANGVANRFLHKLFNQRLAPCVQHSPAETAAEPTDPCKPNAGDFDCFTIEHVYSSVIENL